MAVDNSWLLVPRSTLGRLDELGKGGTAAVYRAPELTVPGADEAVYKEYEPAIRAHAGPALRIGLLSLVQFREEKLTPEQRRAWDARVVWPLRVVTNDEGAAVGILMRLIPPHFFQPLTGRRGGVSHKPREVEKLFGDPADMARLGMPAVDEGTRLRLVARIAATYAMMHRAGVVVGDVSGRNLVYDVSGKQPEVLVVDSDSARVAGSRGPFGNQPHTPNWEPPESLSARRLHRHLTRNGTSDPTVVGPVNNSMVQSKATDVYKFGLLVVRILDYGRGRSVNRDPAAAEAVLRRTVGTAGALLLRRTLSTNPADRPELREWYDVLHGPGRKRTPGAPTPRVGGGTAPGAAPTAAPAPTPAPSPVADGQVSGQWTFVEGVGWTRTSSSGTP